MVIRAQLVFVAFLLCPFGSAAQEWVLYDDAPDGVLAGSQIDAVGDTTFLAGFPFGPDTGVFLYSRSNEGWDRERLTDEYDRRLQFGLGVSGVSIDGELDGFAVASPYESSGGSLYSYERVMGEWTRTVVSSGIYAEAHAVPGIIAGLVLDGTGGLKLTVLAERDAAWEELFSQPTMASARVGQPVSFNGSEVALGKPAATVGAVESTGEVEFISLASSEREVLRPALPGVEFGHSVLLAGHLLFVGAVAQEVAGLPRAGAVHVFARRGGEWVREAELVSPEPEATAAFGSAIGVSGETLVVGAAFASDVSENAGAAYLFRFVDGEWRFTERLVPDTLTPFAAYGVGIEVAPDFVLVSARVPEEGTNGRLFIFERDSDRDGVPDLVDPCPDFLCPDGGMVVSDGGPPSGDSGPGASAVTYGCGCQVLGRRTSDVVMLFWGIGALVVFRIRRR